ncbi:alpha/beta fold hydrolase [Lacisediminihabitans sp. H27-G8]|uniref:alpha/beta fold hydrolase n=1 Tax=Lacisediminihabitans sp. H27-G8 TaxID=3111909 RepID=UPI0038FC9BC8
MAPTGTPVVFIHGLWLGASSWQPWVDLFTARGYSPMAPTWPGESESIELARSHPEDAAGFGIDEVAGHFAAIIEKLDRPPIIIGHSFGGMIAEKLLGENYGIAAIAIDAAQIKGVLPLPVFKNPANAHRAVSLSADEFHYGFGNAVSPEESEALWEAWNIPSPGKPLFEAAGANFSHNSPAKVNTENQARGPLLLIMGGKDHTVPEAITKATLKQYKDSSAITDLVEFADRGHSLTIDSGWREVAEECLTWLDSQTLTA